MTPDRHPWLERWLQTDEDELLYVDQTLLLENGLTLEEHRRLVQAQDDGQAPHDEAGEYL